MERFAFWLGAEHPVYQVFDKRLPHTVEPYAWYVRVPDLPGFLRHVAPVLEQRLESSPLVGHSGELKISFYRSGLRLAFEGGRLVDVEPWQPTPEQEGDAGFPDLTFLQLLFGYRSMEELDHAFADCWASGDKARPLFDALFPKCHIQYLACVLDRPRRVPRIASLRMARCPGIMSRRLRNTYTQYTERG